MATRDELRAKLLASKKLRRFELVQVDVEGELVSVEVRAPNLKEENQISRAATKLTPDKSAPDGVKVDFDALAQKVKAALLLVYVPGTNQRLFEDADAADIEAAETGSWHDQICAAAVKMLRSDEKRIEAIEKNSVSGPSESSSTK